MQQSTNLPILEYSVKEQCVISSLLIAVTAVSSCRCIPPSLPLIILTTNSQYKTMASQWTQSHCSIWLGEPSGHPVRVSWYLTKYTSQSLIIDARTNLL